MSASSPTQNFSGADEHRDPDIARRLELGHVTAADCQSIGDLIVGVMMLAITVMLMSIFYLINSRNRDLNKYTWSILEATASIIAAIMLSECGKDVFYLVWHPAKHGYVRVNLCYALFCSVVTQAAAFAMVSVTGTSRQTGLSRRLVCTKAFAGVMARFSAFSWITFWSGLQGLEISGVQPPYAWVLLAALGTWILLMCATLGLRWVLIHKDGVVDENEKEWEVLTNQNEIDAAGMNLSFLCSQLCRYYVGGVMPNPAGVEHAAGERPRAEVFHPPSHILSLLSCAVVAKVLAIALETSVIHYSQLYANSPHQARLWLAQRVPSILVSALHKTTGWLLLFSMGWSVGKLWYKSRILDLTLTAADDSVQVRMVTAVLCTYASVLGIVLLDFLPGSPVGRFKSGVLVSFSMMVGFAWRRCFGLSIDYVTGFADQHGFTIGDPSSHAGELVLEILIGLPVALIVMPALYWYITPGVLLADRACFVLNLPGCGCESQSTQDYSEYDISPVSGRSQRSVRFSVPQPTARRVSAPMTRDRTSTDMSIIELAPCSTFGSAAGTMPKAW